MAQKKATQTADISLDEMLSQDAELASIFGAGRVLYTQPEVMQAAPEAGSRTPGLEVEKPSSFIKERIS